MITAIDTSVLVCWLAGSDYAQPAVFDVLLDASEAVLPAVVVTELYAGATSEAAMGTVLSGYRILHPLDGYWRRAGLLRAATIRRRRKARLGDALIAQACIDADVPLLTRDDDFGIFAEVGGLKLA